MTLLLNVTLCQVSLSQLRRVTVGSIGVFVFNHNIQARFNSLPLLSRTPPSSYSLPFPASSSLQHNHLPYHLQHSPSTNASTSLYAPDGVPVTLTHQHPPAAFNTMSYVSSTRMQGAGDVTPYIDTSRYRPCSSPLLISAMVEYLIAATALTWCMTGTAQCHLRIITSSSSSNCRRLLPLLSLSRVGG